ncbi:uncharacterized protein LOC130648030 [Hydractinia symbiolongicarpus]|uniref:uncharacterized protein LOC130648030 n=1 Tax=Hydractinia symbiolongicarpus TaxID=13093 RepID=UPI00254B469A|nr:uncharacterized protein LOC130648030 [Hydractinia symbiolongicarpus]
MHLVISNSSVIAIVQISGVVNYSIEVVVLATRDFTVYSDRNRNGARPAADYGLGNTAFREIFEIHMVCEWIQRVLHSAIIFLFPPCLIILLKSMEAPEIKSSTKEVDQLYHQISNIINKYKNKSLITLIAGDFNSRVGKAKEECTGIYGKGKRNDNGQLLIDFCNISKLFLANTAFNHPAKHITTWANQRQNANKDKVITIYSQIDFIIVLQKQKHILQDARSFSGTMTSSDHRLVLSKIKVKPFQVFKKTRTVKDNIKKVDIAHLTNNENMRKAYQQNLETSLQSNVSENISIKEKWDAVKQSIKSAAEQTLPRQIPRNRNHGHNYDPEIEQMSKTQKELRIQISNCKDLDKMTRLKNERNNIMRRIKDKLLENKTKEIENKLSEINQMKDTAKTFKALRMLHSKPYENPYVHDETGKHIASPQLVYETIKSHFQTQFYKPNETNLQQFIDNPKPLNQPITTEEIRKCANLLNNNRASGFDNISAELIKYAPTICHNEIADIVNDCFNKNEDIDVGKGILIPLCKPKKPKGPVKNLRPVTLLPIIRKIISNVALQRIKPKIDDYLSLSQSAFRQNRSTSDAVWTHRWLVARIEKYQEKIYITGIDMSSAFDTIKRDELLNILGNVINEDELRLIRFLLANTSLEIRISLRKVRKILEKDHILDEHSYSKRNESLLPVTEDNLLVNETKTEHTLLERKKKVNNETNEPWRHVKKLGSKLGIHEDIANRKALLTAALQKISDVWIKKDKISTQLKIRIYQTVVKSILLYNCGTWGLNKNEEKNMNSFHRRQLRQVLNIKYPVTIRNKKLYEISKTRPITLDIIQARWRLFGHVLRLQKDTPAQLAMNHYFEQSQVSKFKGRQRITLPISLNNDIRRAVESDNSFAIKFGVSQLISKHDLKVLRVIAEDRNTWKSLSRHIYIAAEATTYTEENLTVDDRSEDS